MASRCMHTRVAYPQAKRLSRRLCSPQRTRKSAHSSMICGLSDDCIRPFHLACTRWSPSAAVCHGRGSLVAGSFTPRATVLKRTVSPCAYASSAFLGEERLVREATYEGYWFWKGHKIRYQRSGEEGPAVLLVHGFGGNCDHWRKNTPALGKSFRAFSIDLLGYGYSDKPDPRQGAPNSIYCFENWGQQLVEFVDQVIQQPAVLSCNSVGGLAGLQASIIAPDKVKAVQLLDISLRGLHVTRQPPWQRPLVASFQRVLRETTLGRTFFANVATAKSVKNILTQAYGIKSAVTDELVDAILRPGLQPGAVDVFLDFICYSGGPLPEELLARTTVPVSMLWGEKDPWEDVCLGKKLLSGYPCVEEFVPLSGLGHCPHDEAPEVVNPLIASFVKRHLSSSATSSEAMLAADALPATL